MYITEVIPAKRWRNVKTKQTASIYGAVPYQSEITKNDWVMESVGFTWRRSDGSIGLGRQPAETEIEAIQIMRSINTKYLAEFVKRIPNAVKFHVNWSKNILNVYFDNIHSKEFDLTEIIK